MMSLFSPFPAVVTGWETENKYRVRNTVGQQVYFAAESKCTGYTVHIYTRSEEVHVCGQSVKVYNPVIVSPFSLCLRTL